MPENDYQQPDEPGLIGRVHVCVTPREQRLVEERAAKEGRSVSNLVRLWIRRRLRLKD